MRENERKVNRSGWETRVNSERIRRGWGYPGMREITSFFFSNFPDEMNEVGLWKIFQRWGKVREVIVAGKRTKEGRRFGFVRFQGVRNDKELEYQLDKITIGNRRLFVNLPKYNRRRSQERKQEDVTLREKGSYAQETKEEGIKNLERVNNGVHLRKEYSGECSYAQVLKGRPTKVWEKKVCEGGRDEKWKDMAFQCEEVNNEWLHEAMVGRVKEPMKFIGVKEALILEGLSSIKI